MKTKSKSHQLHEKSMNLAEDAFFEERVFRSIKPIEIHEQAMNQSFKAKQEKNKEKVKELYKSAFELEKQAAMLLLNHPVQKVEPTRAVLFRSAAWLAINAGLHKEAFEMATLGLKGVIHSDIKKELKEVLQKAKKKLK